MTHLPMTPRLTRRLAALFLALSVLSLPARATEMVLVLDASNSMWGQIDGRPKIVIAREVMDRLLDDMPADTALALVAYGHRRDADCGDIETLVPLGRTNHEDIRRSVDRLTPRGKTPLAGAVDHALSIVGGDGASTVVVLTDGVESCDGDPCAVIDAAARSGGSFTLHTVALGVDAAQDDQLRCMAAAGGGRHYAASDAGQLLDGLRQAVAAAPAPIGAADDVRDGAFGTPPRAERRRLARTNPVFAEELMETDADGFTRLRFADESRLNIGANSRMTLDRFVYDPDSGAGEMTVNAARGVFRFISGKLDRSGVALRSPVATIGVRGTDLVYEVAADHVTRVWVLDGEVLVTASATGEQAVLGPLESARVLVDGAIESADFDLPDDEGLALLTGNLALSASATAPAGALAHPEVTWEVRGTNDGQPVVSFVADERQLHLPVGEYAVSARYDEQIREQGVRVVNEETVSVDVLFEIVAASIDVAAASGIGTWVDVSWDGPGGRGDFISVAEPSMNDARHVNFAWVRNGNPASLQLPDWPGEFEVRYVAQGGRVLAREHITVEPVSTTLDAPASAPAGGDVAVTWRGPDNPSDYLTVVATGTPDGQHGNYAYTRAGSPLDLRMPDAGGEFEIRYVSNQSRRVLARRTIRLELIEATLDAPSSAVAGNDISVSWSGPDNPGDYLTVVAVGTPDGQHGNYAYTRAGSPLELRTPDTGGAFEIRYVSGQSRAVLDRRRIDLSAAEVSVEVLESFLPGEELPVFWRGPNNPGDYLTVVPADSEPRASGTYAYTRVGTPLVLTGPETSGEFEVRYVSGQSRRVLASAKIRGSNAPAPTIECDGFDLSYRQEGALIFGRYTPDGRDAPDGRLFLQESGGQWTGMWTERRGKANCDEARNGMRAWGQVTGTLTNARPMLSIGRCDEPPNEPWAIGECRPRP